MKTFPPLHELTAKGLPYCDDIESTRRTVRSAFNADIEPRLGNLMLDLHRLAFCGPIEGENEPDIATLADEFGRMAAAAMLAGDVSFFDQVRHAISYGEKPTEAHNLDQNSLAREAHFRAQLAIPSTTQGGATIWGCTPPHASQVAKAIDRIEGNPVGTTEASAAIDLMNRKAVSLPVAKGKRGPSKK